MNQGAVITLLLALAAGAGCQKNSPEALARAQAAANAQCDCVAQTMQKPWTEMQAGDCDKPKAAFYEALEGLDMTDKKAAVIMDLGRDCTTKLSDTMTEVSQRRAPK